RAGGPRAHPRRPADRAGRTTRRAALHERRHVRRPADARARSAAGLVPIRDHGALADRVEAPVRALRAAARRVAVGRRRTQPGARALLDTVLVMATLEQRASHLKEN